MIKPNSIDPEAFYTVQEAAEILKKHPQTVRTNIYNGKIKANKVNKMHHISGRTLLDYLGV